LHSSTANYFVEKRHSCLNKLMILRGIDVSQQCKFDPVAITQAVSKTGNVVCGYVKHYNTILYLHTAHIQSANRMIRFTSILCYGPYS
jgi:hypothetical protein